MPKQSSHLHRKRDLLFHDPTLGLLEDHKKIYKGNRFSPTKLLLKDFQNPHARKNTIAVCGVALGDEGKGRIVDNYIEELLKRKAITKVAVVRYQGGNNAGHTIEKGNIKLALHLVPSCVLYQKAFGVMDRGMVIHPEDLMTEVGYVEKEVTLRKRLFLSFDAILNTDLERAEEVVNRIMTGKAKGGTGRGIGPSYAHHLDRLGLTIFDLISDNWKDLVGEQYRRYEKLFAAFDLKLATDISVPDFFESVKQKKSITRTVGSKKTFMERLTFAREWLLQRNMITDTFLLHKETYLNAKIGVVFEGAQATGLDSWLGTWPDVTASNTRIEGVSEGTAFWQAKDIESKVGVFKIPYTSSVGERLMPTHVNIPKDATNASEDFTDDQKWALWIRKEAHEYGTTTGRPRDITHLDLEFLRYNAKMSGIEMLAGTHLDSATEDQEIKVCTHYTDHRGRPMSYQPGLHHLEHVKPNYISLPGWDGKAAAKAKRAKDLPQNALKFLSFIEARTGYPIVLATTGTKRENIISF